jgi:tetrahydromethanopterin S-methyltransferase subunit F
MMNEWIFALIAGGVVFAVLLLGPIVSLAIQSSWAWVNDSEIGDNWFCVNITKTKTYKLKSPSGVAAYYTINKEYAGMVFSDVPEKMRFKSKIEAQCCEAFAYGIVFACAPLVLLLAVKLWSITAPAALLVGMAHLTRFGLRCRKALNAHTKDKNAHKEESAGPEQE